MPTDQDSPPPPPSSSQPMSSTMQPNVVRTRLITERSWAPNVPVNVTLASTRTRRRPRMPTTSPDSKGLPQSDSISDFEPSPSKRPRNEKANTVHLNPGEEQSQVVEEGIQTMVNIEAGGANPQEESGRQKENEKVTLSASEAHRHQGLWFEDGTIVITTSDNLSFRIHRGLLARHSQVFKELIDAARALVIASGESRPGDLVLRLPERGVDLSTFFELIYDGTQCSYFDRDSSISFIEFRTIMLLASKYKVKHVLDAGLWRLRVLFPSTLDKWTNWPAAGADFPIKIAAVDAMAVIQLARSSGFTDILPAAFYISSTISHLSLLTPVAYGFESLQLSAADFIICLKALDALQEMRGRITRVILVFAKNIPEVSQDHAGPINCSLAFQELAVQAHDSGLLTTPRCFDPVIPWIQEVRKKLQVRMCPECEDALQTELNTRMHAEWLKLGELFGVANWPSTAP